MGNKLHREEIVFLNQNKTTRIWRPDGTELYMHRDEVFEKGRLKEGHYVAQQHNPLTGQTLHWSLSKGGDKDSKTPTTTSAANTHRDHAQQPSPGPDRDVSEPGDSTAGGSGTEAQTLPGIESIKPITHQPYSAPAAGDSDPTSQDDSEVCHDSASWTKLTTDDDSSEAGSDDPNAKRDSSTHKGKSEIDAEKAESGPSKFSLINLRAIFSGGGRQPQVETQRVESQTQDNTSSQCVAGDKASITDTVCLEFFKGIANSV